MTHTIYTSISEINKLQKHIMGFIKSWVASNKTPVPHSAILKEGQLCGVPDITTVGAINALLHKGYIRKAVIISNKTYYVQLRNI